jgi:hypothetical protein
VRETFAGASIILEYGSGGSTVLAAGMPDKYVMSVESDRDWALDLQLYIDQAALPSPAVVYWVDIGEVGAWGRPRSAAAWSTFRLYPLAIWDEPFFRHPDVILIDGRFRAACLATALMRITRPVTILFDDYAGRPQYHEIEALVRPVRIVERMACFEIEPGPFPKEATSLIVGTFSQASYSVEHAPERPSAKDPDTEG